jgi:flagellin FlaB
MNRKAEMGIGTLIIFIAMILVAAIAAGVLIQTATSLQNKALLAGTRTKGQVSTAIQFLLVYAEDGSSPTKTVSDFFFKAKTCCRI